MTATESTAQTNYPETDEDWKQLDQPGVSLCAAVGYADTGAICAEIRECDAADCDCVGSWKDGSPEHVVSWKYRWPLA